MKSDFPSEKFARFVRVIIDIARHRMHLQEWAIQLRYYQKDSNDSKNRKIFRLAETVAQPTYIDATIWIYPRLQYYYEQKDYWNVTSTICHELSHCLTQRMYDIALRSVKTETEEISHEAELLTCRISNLALVQVWKDVEAILRKK